MNDTPRQLLLRSFDETLSPSEQEILNRALAVSAELRAEKSRIANTAQMLAAHADRSVQPFLAGRVQQRILEMAARENELAAVWRWAFRRVVLAGATLLAMWLGQHVAAGKHFAVAAVLGWPQLSLATVWQMNVLE